MVVLGLLVRVFAGALLGAPRGISVEPYRIDVNRAGVPELTILPGIGRTRAEAILVHRIRHGPFLNLADLERVDGLGPVITSGFRDMVAFSSPTATGER